MHLGSWHVVIVLKSFCVSNKKVNFILSGLGIPAVLNPVTLSQPLYYFSSDKMDNEGKDFSVPRFKLRQVFTGAFVSCKHIFTSKGQMFEESVTAISLARSFA